MKLHSKSFPSQLPTSRTQDQTRSSSQPTSSPQHPAPNTHLLRVRYAETDQAGMAHHSAFLPWFEVGRVELLRNLGKPYQEFEAEGLHFPVREAFCRYWVPARFDDLLCIATTVEDVGGASVRFGYRITREADAVLIAEGSTLHACVDDSGKVRRLPAAVKTMLAG